MLDDFLVENGQNVTKVLDFILVTTLMFFCYAIFETEPMPICGIVRFIDKRDIVFIFITVTAQNFLKNVRHMICRSRFCRETYLL